MLPNGALVVSGGRPALNLWVNRDGTALGDWEAYDLPTEHNRLVEDPSLRFCEQFENATAALGWEQSSAYTRLAALDNDTGLVCYNRQGAASGGTDPPPAGCDGDGSQLFCMRFTVQGGA